MLKFVAHLILAKRARTYIYDPYIALSINGYRVAEEKDGKGEEGGTNFVQSAKKQTKNASFKM